jgi:hypothetical protein
MGDSRKKIAKQDDLYIKDASRAPRLITTRRWRGQVMSEPPTMLVVPRFGISHMPVSREFAREWQFNGLPTTRQSGFRDRRVTGASRSGRQTSHKMTSGQSPGRRIRRSAVGQDYL